MKRINQIATINDVSLNDKLKEWNEENDAFRVQLRIAYAADSSKDEEDEDLLSLADFEEAGASVGKTFTNPHPLYSSSAWPKSKSPSTISSMRFFSLLNSLSSSSMFPKYVLARDE